MGVSRFYRWISERYPLLNEKISSVQVAPFDNLYLDMNGIVHNCSHGNSGETLFNKEEELWLSIFQYISYIVSVVRPQKLLYLAVDGVAPQAKMNQQRSRRFRASKEQTDRETKTKEMQTIKTLHEHSNITNYHNTQQTQEATFDSNCITPGTEFMYLLGQQLDFYVHMKLHDDPIWSNLKVILSGSDVPGEGEHKIIDYIRRAKSQSDYDPNTRHCLYGLDADLIMLGLISHEPHFSLLREEIQFGRAGNNNKLEQRKFGTTPSFQFFHIGLLREYIQLDFTVSKPDIQDTVQLESPVSDPETNDLCNNETIIHLETLSNTLSKNQQDNLNNLLKVFNLERVIDDLILFCFLSGNDFLPHLPFTEIGSGGLHRMMNIYRQYLFIVTNTQECSDPWITKDCGTINWKNFFNFLSLWGQHEADYLNKQLDDLQYMKQKSSYSKKSHQLFSQTIDKTSFIDQTSQTFRKKLDYPINISQEHPLDSTQQCNSHSLLKEPLSSFEPLSPPKTVQDALNQYYDRKMNIQFNTVKGQKELDELIQAYLEGLQWILWYYYRGPPSWDWCYPYHYPPYVQTLLSYTPFSTGTLRIEFSNSLPFLPFQQLLCVLPSKSSYLVPKIYQSLMLDANSSLIEYYPKEFTIDMEGVLVPWGGITLIPFVDPSKLINAMKTIDTVSHLTIEETKRNRIGEPVLYMQDPNHVQQDQHIVSTLPTLFQSITQSKVIKQIYNHPEYINGMTCFKNDCLEGVNYPLPGFPSLYDLNITSAYFDQGIVVFNDKPARLPGLYLTVESPLSLGSLTMGTESSCNINELNYTVEDLPVIVSEPDPMVFSYFKSILDSETVVIDYPYRHIAKPIGLWSETYYLRTSNAVQTKKDKGKSNQLLDGLSSSTAFLFQTSESIHMNKQPDIVSEELTRMRQSGIEHQGIDTEQSKEIIQQCIVKALKLPHHKSKLGKKDIDLSLYKSCTIETLIVELLLAEETIYTDTGISYKFGYQPIYRLLCAVLPDIRPHHIPLPSLYTLSIGTTVMCTHEHNPLFGYTGKITSLGQASSEIESIIEFPQINYDSRWSLQKTLHDMTSSIMNDIQWFTLNDISKSLSISMSVLNIITCSLWITLSGTEFERLNIGMDLVGIDSKTREPLCLPSITSIVPSFGVNGSVDSSYKFLYSSEAVNMISHYYTQWPEVFLALQSANRTTYQSNGKKKPIRLTASSLFPKHPDPNWCTQLVYKWCRYQLFSRVSSAGGFHQALTHKGIMQIERCLNEWSQQNNCQHKMILRGVKHICPMDSMGSLPDSLLAASSHKFIKTQQYRYLGNLLVGQCVVYTKWKGLIPFGSFGCIVATTIHPVSQEQLIEMITMLPYLNCTRLNGRCSSMRGIIVPASSVMAIYPKVYRWGLSAPTLSDYQRQIRPSIERLQLQQPSTSDTTEKNSHYTLAIIQIHPSISDSTQIDKQQLGKMLNMKQHHKKIESNISSLCPTHHVKESFNQYPKQMASSAMTESPSVIITTSKKVTVDLLFDAAAKATKQHQTELSLKTLDTKNKLPNEQHRSNNNNNNNLQSVYTKEPASSVMDILNRVTQVKGYPYKSFNNDNIKGKKTIQQSTTPSESLIYSQLSNKQDPLLKKNNLQQNFTQQMETQHSHNIQLSETTKLVGHDINSFDNTIHTSNKTSTLSQNLPHPLLKLIKTSSTFHNHESQPSDNSSVSQHIDHSPFITNNTTRFLSQQYVQKRPQLLRSQQQHLQNEQYYQQQHHHYDGYLSQTPVDVPKNSRSQRTHKDHSGRVTHSSGRPVAPVSIPNFNRH